MLLRRDFQQLFRAQERHLPFLSIVDEKCHPLYKIWSLKGLEVRLYYECPVFLGPLEEKGDESKVSSCSF